ncbi:M23 family metallopeptidase [Paenibacillus harenae]|uniref:M23 family metallopeptidase n=1 Tax=Paenibacillus harenae TaxID=306543 RepID=UPI00278E72AA|nr:M23 family metallopeptidase [Paenibacillus harenae]MDQ0060603.1 murein DD-endopeptidase MepM/ murein hydrolase activator NlpD [Paenibacillus harenae]
MKRARNPKWSFVVMRGADKTVKQFHVSKRSVVALPTVAVLAVSGWIAGLQIQATDEIDGLEEQLSNQTAQYTQTVSGKDEAIVSLQQELLQLSRQAQELKVKLSELQELENKLKQFIEKYGSGIAPSSGESDGGENEVSALSAATSSGATYSSPASYASVSTYGNARQLASLAQYTGLDLQALSSMVDTMEISMEQTLRQAQARREAVDGYPSGWPTRSKQLTSGFGYRKDPFTGRVAFHAGIDISGKSGDPVFSAAEGNVTETGIDGVFGKYIVIEHLGGLKTSYMHLKQIEAKEGDFVVRGEKIGLLGSSGRSTGPHLHFEILQQSEPVNPLKYLALVKEN